MKNIFLLLLAGVIAGALLGLRRTGYIYRGGSVMPLGSPPVYSPVPSPAVHTSVIFTGDVMLGRKVNMQSLTAKDFRWPFYSVFQVMSSPDLTVVNLENPVVTDCPVTSTGFQFCAPPGAVSGLTFAGIDLVSLANNHTTNYGASGLSDTKRYLDEAGIGYVGLGVPYIAERNGIRFGFLAYNDTGKLNGIANADPDKMAEDIKELRTKIDVLMVMFHWGVEYKDKPNDRQVILAHKAIESGADAVIGGHPHWIQTHETYHGKPIYYSLGNFIFDQEWSKETKRGLAVRLNYEGSELKSVTELPVLIENYGQANWVEDSQ